MQIKIKTLRGVIYTLEIEPNASIDDAKNKFAKIVKIPSNYQGFVFKGKLIENGTIEQLGIKDKDFVVVFPTFKKISSEKSPQNVSEIKEVKAESITKEFPSNSSPNTNNTNTFHSGDRAPLVTLTSNVHQLLNALEVTETPIKFGTSEANEVALHQLLDMGFPEARARKALQLSRNDPTRAMEWLFQHEGDPNIDQPLTENESKDGSFVPDPFAIEKLGEMGFRGPQVTSALEATNNDYEAAAAWLLGDRDVEEDDDILGGDENHSLIRSFLSDSSVRSSLDNPELLNAVKRIMEDPSSLQNYINDPQIGPLLIQLHSIAQLKDDEEEEGDEDDEDDEEDEESEENEEEQDLLEEKQEQ